MAKRRGGEREAGERGRERGRRGREREKAGRGEKEREQRICNPSGTQPRSLGHPGRAWYTCTKDSAAPLGPSSL